MTLIDTLFGKKSEHNQGKYEKSKRKKISRYAKKYGVKEWGNYTFSRGTPEDLYLESLKRDLIEQKLTMLGKQKLDTLRFCIEDVLKQSIPGDIIETGVWKGGATIYAAGILKAHRDIQKKVFVADSFAGLPRPDAQKYPQDKGGTHHTRKDLAVGLEEVKDNFSRFDLLSKQVVFIRGFFEVSLQSADIEKLSVLRLDGDMYGSTMTVLKQLYHKLEIGGYLILDDWLLTGARKALLDFCSQIGIEEEMYQDYSGVFWKKSMPTVTPEL